MELDASNWCTTIFNSNNFENWMTELPAELKCIPINQLAIPGTHDSMSYGITRKSSVSPDSTSLVKVLAKLLGPLIKPAIYNWSVTQKSLALKQLTEGIRYFDLRIAVHKREQTFQFVHGMYAQEILEPLTDIRKFLLSHREEVVILDLQHFYDFSPQDHLRLQEILRELFEKLACPHSLDVTTFTLQRMVSNGNQMVILYRSDERNEVPWLWPSALWPSPWPNTTSANRMINFLQKNLQKRPLHAGYITQCVLTPTTWFVVKNLFSNLHKKCALPCNRASISWLKQQSTGPRGINVVITDFFDCDTDFFPFVRTVVGLNSYHILNITLQ